jgi:hypothetical protein
MEMQEERINFTEIKLDSLVKRAQDQKAALPREAYR